MITTSGDLKEYPKNECENCSRKTAKPLVYFGGRMLCPFCMDEIGEGFDDLEIKTIVKRRGRNWIEEILNKLEK